MMTYEYDTLSRNRKITDNTLGTFTQTTYDTAGRPKTQIDAKNQTMTYQLYDVLDRPLDVQDRLSYDAEDRFTKFNRPNLSSGAESVTFDRSAGIPSIGNIVEITGGAYDGIREFNDIHQLGGAGVVAQTQTFDGVGNLTAAENGNSYAWNMAAGRMESATVSENDQYYRYDAAGRRAWKETDDGTTNTKTVFIYSGPNCIAEYNEGAVFSTPGNEYVYAGGIDSLAMVVHNNNAKSLSVIRNQQWSVIGLVNIVTATIEELYSYNVFGERTILDPGTANSRTASTVNNPYGYTSRRHDDETGMMYFRARFYDPTTGEFVSKDPGGYVDGYSLYRGYFVPNSTDAFGLKCTVCGKGFSGGTPGGVGPNGDFISALDAEVVGTPYRQMTDLYWPEDPVRRYQTAYPGGFWEPFPGSAPTITGWGWYESNAVSGAGFNIPQGVRVIDFRLHFVWFDVMEDAPGDCTIDVLEKQKKEENNFDGMGWVTTKDEQNWITTIRRNAPPQHPAQNANNQIADLVTKNGCCDKRIILTDISNVDSQLKSITVGGRTAPKFHRNITVQQNVRIWGDGEIQSNYEHTWQVGRK